MSDLRPGTVIAGRFRIERRIGAGAMAFVYEATHLELRQKVALKILNDQFRADPDAASRFVREARAQFSLRSEHVGRVFDVARTESGQPLIVMELLEGKSLKEELEERERFAVKDAVEILRQVCDGVGEAHALGIVHRDLKPGNIFVSRLEGGRPWVKVIDFGLAKARDHASEGSLTAADMLIGTPRYMAPEQFAGAGSAGTHTDVWALGIVLFRLLTGELPFDGPHPLAIAARIRSEDAPSPSRFVPEVPEALSAIVLKCLARDPARRYPRASALGAALAEVDVAPRLGKTGGARAVGGRSRPSVPSEDSVQELSLRDADETDDETEVVETAPVSDEWPTQVGVGAAVSHAVVVPAAVADTSIMATTGTSETRMAAVPPASAAPRPRGVAPTPMAKFAAPRLITPRDGVPAVAAVPPPIGLPPPIEDGEEIQTRRRPALVGPQAQARRGPTPAAVVPAMTQPLPPGARISAPPPHLSPIAIEAMKRAAPMPPGGLPLGALASEPRGVPLPPPSGTSPGMAPATTTGLPPALDDLWRKLLALGPPGIAAVALSWLLGLLVLGTRIADCGARPVTKNAPGVSSVRAPLTPPPAQVPPAGKVFPGPTR